jgi:hypothetical protein
MHLSTNIRFNTNNHIMQNKANPASSETMPDRFLLAHKPAGGKLAGQQLEFLDA